MIKEISAKTLTASVLDRDAVRSRFADFVELTKPRITLLVLVTTGVGYYLACGNSFSLSLLIHTLIGTALMSAGSCTLNMVLEQGPDGRMQRTRRRPLPAGRLSSAEAWGFGVAQSAIGIVYLAALVNLLTSLLALVALATYLFVYTPLKLRTPLCTLVGAVSGAIPPMMGWAAARNEIGPESWILFAVLFTWQMPHFFAIAWLFRDDYARGGFPMLPVVDPAGRATARQMILFTLALVAASLLPTFVHFSGFAYLAVAMMLGLAFLIMNVQFSQSRSAAQARRLFLASLAYLTVLLAVMVLDKV